MSTSDFTGQNVAFEVEVAWRQYAPPADPPSVAQVAHFEYDTVLNDDEVAHRLTGPFNPGFRTF